MTHQFSKALVRQQVLGRPEMPLMVVYFSTTHRPVETLRASESPVNLEGSVEPLVSDGLPVIIPAWLFHERESKPQGLLETCLVSGHIPHSQPEGKKPSSLIR